MLLRKDTLAAITMLLAVQFTAGKAIANHSPIKYKPRLVNPVKFKTVSKLLEYKRIEAFEGKAAAKVFLNDYRKSSLLLPTTDQVASILFSNASGNTFGQIGGYSDGRISFGTGPSNAVTEKMRLTSSGEFALFNNSAEKYFKLNENNLILGIDNESGSPYFNVSPSSLYLNNNIGESIFKVNYSELDYNWGYFRVGMDYGSHMTMYGVDYEIMNIVQDNYKIGNSDPYGGGTMGGASLAFGQLSGNFLLRGSDHLVVKNADDICYFKVGKNSQLAWDWWGVNPADAPLEVKLGDNTITLPGSAPTDKIVTIDEYGNLHKTSSSVSMMGESMGSTRKFNSDLAIGNITPTDTSFNLFVEKGILTRKVTVNPNKWADYVFNTDYKLRSLQDLETFINKNKHLPDVPTAETVAKEGVNVGDNQAVLLKKIEELTLYLIEQNKKIEQQQQLITDQKKAFDTLQKQVDALKK